MKAGDLYAEFLARITGVPPSHVCELAAELAQKNGLPPPDAEVTVEEGAELLDLVRKNRNHLIRSLFIEGPIHCGWPLFNCACTADLPAEEGSVSESGDSPADECCPCCCEIEYNPEEPRCRGCRFADRCC